MAKCEPWVGHPAASIMNSMKSKHFKHIVLKLALLSCFQFASVSTGVFAQTATIQVRVVDGRTGHPISGMSLTFVDYHTDEDGGYLDDLNGRKTVTTSVEGDSYVAEPDVHGILVFNVMGRDSMWTPCSKQKFYDGNTRKYGTDYLYPVPTIVTSGLVAKNDCSKRTAGAKAGELLIFIRPTTWWERFVSGMKS
jgi:hypothetical protein